MQRHSYGYILESVPGHPRARSPRRGCVVYQHILVAEKALGRALPPKAVVHHIDGCTSNNANSNLVICQDNVYHMALHARQRIVRLGGVPEQDKICGQCHDLLSREMFYRKSCLFDGLQVYCKTCVQANNKRDSATRRAAKKRAKT